MFDTELNQDNADPARQWPKGTKVIVVTDDGIARAGTVGHTTEHLDVWVAFDRFIRVYNQRMIGQYFDSSELRSR